MKMIIVSLASLFVVFVITFFFFFQNVPSNSSIDTPISNKFIHSKNVLHELDVIKPKSEEKHFMLYSPMDSQSCSYSGVRPLRQHNIKENKMNTEIIQLNSINNSIHYHLCIGTHSHQHTLKFVISNTSEYNCYIFTSATKPKPSINNWDWKSNSKSLYKMNSLTIHTYANEFHLQTSQDPGIYITIQVPYDYDDSSISTSTDNIKNKNNVTCIFEYGIYTFTQEEMLHKINLRGGKVLLKRDLEH
jgi:hypothetical protein